MSCIRKWTLHKCYNEDLYNIHVKKPMPCEGCSFLIIWTNNWSYRRTVQLISWVEMKARNPNLLSWKDKKGCIIKKLFFRKREVMQECTIKCFLSAAQVGAVSKKAITNFSSEKAMERKALKHPFLWIEFIPAGSKAIQPIPTLHWTNTQFKSYYFKAFLPCHQWLPKRKHAEVALSFAAEEMMVHSKWDFNLLFFFFFFFFFLSLRER